MSMSMKGCPPVPQYLKLQLPGRVMRSMARFRLSAHNLRVETGRYEGIPWKDRLCDECACFWMRQQNEYHAVFECSATEDVRKEYDELLRAARGDMKTLMNLDHSRVARFIDACMTKFDSDDSVNVNVNV